MKRQATQKPRRFCIQINPTNSKITQYNLHKLFVDLVQKLTLFKFRHKVTVPVDRRILFI